MKRTILYFAISMLFLKTNAQQLLLFEKSSVSEKTEKATVEYETKIESIRDSVNKYTDTVALKNIKGTDSLNFVQKQTIYKDSLDKLKSEKPETKNKFTPPRVTFFASAAGTGTNDGGGDLASSITASGKLAAQFHFFYARNLYCGVSANLAGANRVTPVERDSVDFNSLMFPESGNFGFIFSPGYTFLKFPKTDTNILSTLGATIEFAYRNVNIDSPSIGFKVLNYNFGLKWTWQFRPEDDEVLGFSFMPYYNVFNIPDEDVKDFNEFVNDELFSTLNEHGRFQSAGAKVGVQYNSLSFFFDMRRNLDTGAFDDTNPLKGTVINIGFATAISLKSWQD